MPAKTETSTDGLATVQEAAKYLSICPDTVYRLMKEGVLVNTHIGRARRICWDSLKSLKATGYPKTAV